jgi:hypothetical protein
MQVVFPPRKVRRYVGVRLARCTHKEPPCQSKSARRRGEPERKTNAPEGGGTTQRGDPAPGPMRCGTTASGDERMHQ